MLKVFIVDDEPLARDELKYLLIQSKQVEIVGEAESFEDAIIHIPNQKPDLAFLDIELGDDNGLQLAQQLHALDSTLNIVFATAYDEYAFQAFELNALDYILKPFDENQIRRMLDKINKVQKIGKKDHQSSATLSGHKMRKIAVQADDRIILIDSTTIMFAESSEGKCTIKTTENEYKINETLIMLEKKLNLGPFIRVHRSFIVNIDHITEIQPWFNSTYNLIMKDGSQVPVSRTYVKELKSLLEL